MEKHTYYVNIGVGEISQDKFDNNDYLEIKATEEEIYELRVLMNNMHDASFDSFIRSHIPILSYHKDSANDEFDENFLGAFRMMHDLGNERTRKHIESMGIL